MTRCVCDGAHHAGCPQVELQEHAWRMLAHLKLIDPEGYWRWAGGAAPAGDSREASDARGA